LSFKITFQVVKEQQFGQVVDEREINAIKAKTPEAKASKASETFSLLGRFITTESLEKFIEPMREVVKIQVSALYLKVLDHRAVA
jgi:hypothetical protein